MHFAETVDLFTTQLRANQRSHHTVSSYLRDLEMLRSWLEREGLPMDVDRISPTVLLQFAASPACTHQENGLPRQRSTIDKIKMTVRAFFGFLHDAALIPTNPSRVLKYRRGRERVPETLTEDERRRLLEATTGAHGWRDATILDLFLHTGIRLDALASIDVDDVTLCRGAYSTPCGKLSGERAGLHRPHDVQLSCGIQVRLDHLRAVRLPARIGA